MRRWIGILLIPVHTQSRLVMGRFCVAVDKEKHQANS